MSCAQQMLDSYPRSVNVDASVLAAAIDAISDCAQACTADVDADLSEQNLAEMVRCIRLCLDCTGICTATGGVISRLAEYDASAARPLLEACVAICMSCGNECERHAHYEHCRVCEQRTPGCGRGSWSCAVLWYAAGQRALQRSARGGRCRCCR